MPTPINKQPIFTAKPIMTVKTFDPPIILDNNKTVAGDWSTSPTKVYQTTSTYGDLIERITISATGDTTNTTVTAKLIYIYLYDAVGGRHSLYKTVAMPATTVSATTPNPEIELVFTGGLLLKSGEDAIYIGASDNADNTGQNGDNISVTIEGGTYDQPA
jgi:hypothetical protein